MTTRRTFLRLAGAAATALGITRYAEPMEVVPDWLPGHRDWIEDRGDFYIVRVPDFKSFANERLKKPTIFLLGQGALVTRVDVKGFANVHAKLGGVKMSHCTFDASKFTVGRDRPALEVLAECGGFTISDTRIQSSDCVPPTAGMHTIVLSA